MQIKYKPRFSIRMSIGVVPAHRSAVLRHAGVAFPTNTLFAFQRLQSLAFGCGTFAYAKDQASLPLDGLHKEYPTHALMANPGKLQ